MDKKLLLISVITTLLFAVFTLNTVLHHEVWADEAQVWQLCKNLSMPDLIKHLKNEGHPALFYLLVMPFAKIFSDIIFMKLICWFFVSLSVFLLMYFAPFKWYLKYSIILSAGFIYFFPVLARNYSIIPFLVFLAAILYSKSKQHPVLYAIVLGLLANTHIIMFCFVFCLCVIFFYETIYLSLKNKTTDSLKGSVAAIFIMFTGLLFVYLLLHNTTGDNIFLAINLKNLSLAIQRILTLFFINSYNYDIGVNIDLYNPLLDICAIFSMIIIYILCFKNLFINSKKLFFLALFGIGFQLAIYVVAYNSFVYVNRIFCAHLILIFCYWLLFSQDNIKNKKSAGTLLTIFFALTIYNGFNYTKYDLKLPYSGAKETAEFIQKNIPAQNSVILIDNEPYMISLVYYLKGSHELYSTFRHQNLKYVKWDFIAMSNFADLGWSQYAEYTKGKTNKDIYVINVSSDKKHVLEKTQTDYFELIFKSQKGIEPYEGYRIFKYIAD